MVSTKLVWSADREDRVLARKLGGIDLAVYVSPTFRGSARSVTRSRSAPE
jgi:hypothetical protein